MSENERPEYLDGAAPLSAEREAELRATLTEKIRRIHEAERHPAKLWLWRNHVDGRPEYWAFDNPYPIHMDNGDPQTLGEPCGYALVKPSRNGRPDVPESVVLNSIERACARVERSPVLPCLQPDATDSACKCCQRRFYRDEQSNVELPGAEWSRQLQEAAGSAPVVQHPTPRTDAEEARVVEASQGYLTSCVSADFARQLERERAAGDTNGHS